jgi:hypothetical protein
MGRILIILISMALDFGSENRDFVFITKSGGKNGVMCKFRCCLLGGSFVEETQGWRAVPQGDPVHPHRERYISL